MNGIAEDADGAEDLTAQLDRLKSLRSFCRGVAFVLIAIVAGSAWWGAINLTDPIFVAQGVSAVLLPLLFWGHLLLASLLWVGVILIAKSDWAGPEDRRRRIFRRGLIIAGAAPLLAGICGIFPSWFVAPWMIDRLGDAWWCLGICGVGLFAAAAELATIGSVPLALLLARRLGQASEKLAIRQFKARCRAVGIGWAVVLSSCSVLLTAIIYSATWGHGHLWRTAGPVEHAIGPIVIALSLLVIGTGYICTRILVRGLAAARRLEQAQIRNEQKWAEAESRTPPAGRDVCWHCGYDLRATATDEVCPECGQPAALSRSITTSFSRSSCRWWRRAAWGIWLICLTPILAGFWLLAAPSVSEYFDFNGWEYGNLLLAVGFWLGIYLITRRQGLAMVDDRNRQLRRFLRLAALVPVLAVLSKIFIRIYEGDTATAFSGAILPVALATLGSSPLPLALCLYLRRLVHQGRPTRRTIDLVLLGIGWTTLLIVLGIFVLIVAHDEPRFAATWFDYQLEDFLRELIPPKLWAIAAVLYVSVLFVMVRTSILFLTYSRSISRQIMTVAASSSETTETHSASNTDTCFRCGYDLRATPDDRPCPECGLLAARSRRPGDMLPQSRQRWLRYLAFGSAALVASIVMAMLVKPLVILSRSTLVGWGYDPPATENVATVVDQVGWFSVALVLFSAVMLLTRPQGWFPADRANRSLRRSLRWLALIPLGASAILLMNLLPRVEFAFSDGFPKLDFAGLATRWPRLWIDGSPHPLLETTALFVAALAVLPMPLLLFLYLRRIAKRTRTAHLTRRPVAAGLLGSATLLSVAVFVKSWENISRDGLPEHYAVPLGTLFVMGLSAVLLSFRFIMVLMEFTISFIIAARASTETASGTEPNRQ